MGQKCFKAENFLLGSQHISPKHVDIALGDCKGKQGKDDRDESATIQVYDFL